MGISIILLFLMNWDLIRLLLFFFFERKFGIFLVFFGGFGSFLSGKLRFLVSFRCSAVKIWNFSSEFDVFRAILIE